MHFVWTQTVWHSGIPEDLKKKKIFWKSPADNKKSLQNYTAYKVLTILIV